MAVKNIDSLLEARSTRIIGEGEDVWAAYKKQNAAQVIRGNIVADAQLAGLLLSNGVKRIFILERDFLKFPDLEVIDPCKQQRSAQAFDAIAYRVSQISIRVGRLARLAAPSRHRVLRRKPRASEREDAANRL